MATEEQKMQQKIRVFGLMITGLAKGLYDVLDESAYALMKGVGKDMLEILQKEMALEIEGENPKDVLDELMRIWVDEIGFIEDPSVEETEAGWVVTGHRCKGWNLTQKILEQGVKEPFTCPIMNTMTAALDKMGVRVHMHIEPQPETRGTKFTLTKA